MPHEIVFASTTIKAISNTTLIMERKVKVSDGYTAKILRHFEEN